MKSFSLIFKMSSIYPEGTYVQTDSHAYSEFGWQRAAHQGFCIIPVITQLVASLPGTHKHPVPADPPQTHPVFPPVPALQPPQ